MRHDCPVESLTVDVTGEVLHPGTSAVQHLVQPLVGRLTRLIRDFHKTFTGHLEIVLQMGEYHMNRVYLRDEGVAAQGQPGPPEPPHHQPEVVRKVNLEQKKKLRKKKYHLITISIPSRVTISLF